MTARSIYDSSRLAAGYAFHRPPVHDRVLDLVFAYLGPAHPAHRGLDIGCGAGRSTAALQRRVRHAAGLEPAVAMLEHRRQVAPSAAFAVGTAEALPFAAGTFDLVTAAGALNYVDRRRCLADVERVLAQGGTLVVYDFSSGRQSPSDARLAEWFDAFEQKYPFPPGYDMDVRALDCAHAGLRLQHYEEYGLVLPMAAADYLDYVLTETNVERALRAGVSERSVREWCERGLAPIFGGNPLPIAFTGYFACVDRA